MAAYAAGPASTAIRPATAAGMSRRRPSTGPERRTRPNTRIITVAAVATSDRTGSHGFQPGVRRSSTNAQAAGDRDRQRQHQAPPARAAVCLVQGDRADAGQRGDRRRRGAGVVRVLDALLEAEHEEFQQQPAAPHQHARAREVGPAPPPDEDERADQRDDGERDEPGDLAAKGGAEQPPDARRTPETPEPAGTGPAQAASAGQTAGTGPADAATAAETRAAGYAAETVVADGEVPHGVVGAAADVGTAPSWG